MLTLTDLFCGAGGSSTGAIAVPGVEVRVASNHWQLAVETHNSNHPDADHICADLSQIHPRYFPASDSREQVRMAGNAVTPPAARDLIGCVIEALTGEAA